MVKGRTTYNSDKDKQVRELLKDDLSDEAEKQRLIEQGMAEVRAKWTPKQEHDRLVKKRTLDLIPTIRDCDLGLDESPGAER